MTVVSFLMLKSNQRTHFIDKSKNTKQDNQKFKDMKPIERVKTLKKQIKRIQEKHKISKFRREHGSHVKEYEQMMDKNEIVAGILIAILLVF